MKKAIKNKYAFAGFSFTILTLIVFFCIDFLDRRNAIDIIEFPSVFPLAGLVSSLGMLSGFEFKKVKLRFVLVPLQIMIFLAFVVNAVGMLIPLSLSLRVLLGGIGWTGTIFLVLLTVVNFLLKQEQKE